MSRCLRFYLRELGLPAIVEGANNTLIRASLAFASFSLDTLDLSMVAEVLVKSNAAVLCARGGAHASF